MTTITWKNLKTGKNEIKIYKSRDELINTLRLTTYKITESKKYEYYLTIKSGKKILEQLQLYGVSYEEDDEILEDAIIENKQAIEMSKIYSEVLNGTMDAYASIISNNLNVVMKFLASITIVLSLPTLIASIWGMNVPLPFATNPYGFGIVCGISILLSVVVFIWLKKKDML